MLMMETLREVAPNLWVSDRASAAVVGEDYDLVIDCTGNGPTKGNGRTASLCPEGRTNHDWTPRQLMKIAGGVSKHLADGETVLIHCQRGVSRSSVAAAAVLLRMGVASTVQEALVKTRWDGRQPASVTVGSLKRWWKVYQGQRQGKMFKTA
jgi:protein-tyrosine phosphatase